MTRIEPGMWVRYTGPYQPWTDAGKAGRVTSISAHGVVRVDNQWTAHEADLEPCEPKEHQ